MPTHQGKTQTDIVIGDGGEEIALDGRLEFLATYGTSANFQYKDNASGQNYEDSAYELKVLNVTGATIATFYADYKANPVTGSATIVTTTRTNTFTPSPNGNTPTFPISGWETHGTRAWSVTSTHGGSTFAGFNSTWKFASTVLSGGSVSYAVNTQTNDQLTVTLTYRDASAIILTVVVTCYAKATKTGGVNLGSPSVTDTLQP
jgi:hypothetical protein